MTNSQQFGFNIASVVHKSSADVTLIYSPYARAIGTQLQTCRLTRRRGCQSSLNKSSPGFTTPSFHVRAEVPAFVAASTRIQSLLDKAASSTPPSSTASGAASSSLSESLNFEAVQEFLERNWQYFLDGLSGKHHYEDATVYDLINYIGGALSTVTFPKDVILYCIFAGAALPYLPFFFVLLGRLSVGYNPSAPRALFGLLPPYAQRATWAHQNGFEVYPAFAAAAALTYLTGNTCSFAEWCCVSWVAARVLYPLFYVADLPLLRSVAYVATQTCTVLLFLHLLNLPN